MTDERRANPGALPTVPAEVKGIGGTFLNSPYLLGRTVMRCKPQHPFHPRLELLEDRCTPAGTVTGSLADGVWTLTGDADANNITVNSTGTAGAFTVTGTGTTVTGDTNPTGVTAIVFDMGGGSDSVVMNTNASRIRLESLTVNGGDGDNVFSATLLKVQESLKVTNGIGFDNFHLTDFKVKKSLVIKNGDGGSNTILSTTSAAAGFNTIGRHLKIFNGFGTDHISILDTNVGGNIINENGSGGDAFAGSFLFLNEFQTADRAVIGGDVEVTFLNRDIDISGITDTKVKGNVTFNNGSGNSETFFDGFKTSRPVVIGGNLTINGSGPNEVSLGTGFGESGLTVRGDLRIDLGGTGHTVETFNLKVEGKTEIS